MASYLVEPGDHQICETSAAARFCAYPNFAADVAGWQDRVHQTLAMLPAAALAGRPPLEVIQRPAIIVEQRRLLAQGVRGWLASRRRRPGVSGGPVAGRRSRPSTVRRRVVPVLGARRRRLLPRRPDGCVGRRPPAGSPRRQRAMHRWRPGACRRCALGRCCRHTRWCHDAARRDRPTGHGDGTRDRLRRLGRPAHVGSRLHGRRRRRRTGDARPARRRRPCCARRRLDPLDRSANSLHGTRHRAPPRRDRCGAVAVDEQRPAHERLDGRQGHPVPPAPTARPTGDQDRELATDGAADGRWTRVRDHRQPGWCPTANVDRRRRRRGKQRLPARRSRCRHARFVAHVAADSPPAPRHGRRSSPSDCGGSPPSRSQPTAPAASPLSDARLELCVLVTIALAASAVASSVGDRTTGGIAGAACSIACYATTFLPPQPWLPLPAHPDAPGATPRLLATLACTLAVLAYTSATWL